MSNDKEPASEKEQAIWMANNLLDEPNADPDDDARTISRQFLRALEEITRLKAELAELYQAKNNAHEIHCSMLRSRDVEIGELKAELERERELRKELVSALEYIVKGQSGSKNLSYGPTWIQRWRTLIQKAKN